MPITSPQLPPVVFAAGVRTDFLPTGAAQVGGTVGLFALGQLVAEEVQSPAQPGVQLSLSPEQQQHINNVNALYEGRGRGPLGQPYYDELVIPAGQYALRQPDGGQVVRSYPEFRLPSPVLAVSITKNWTFTPRVNGREVAENSVSDSISASVQGVLLNMDDMITRPDIQAQALRRVVDAPVALPVEGTLAERYGMRYVVITSATFNEGRWANGIEVRLNLRSVLPPEEEGLEDDRLANTYQPSNSTT